MKINQNSHYVTIYHCNVNNYYLYISNLNVIEKINNLTIVTNTIVLIIIIIQLITLNLKKT